MNNEKKEKQLYVRLLELIESSRDTIGVQKSEIRNEYIKEYGPISASRLGGSVDILVELGLVLENKKTGLFSISSLGQLLLSRAKLEKKSVSDLYKALLSKSLNSQNTP